MTEPCVWKFRKQNLTKALYFVSFGILPRWKNNTSVFALAGEEKISHREKQIFFVISMCIPKILIGTYFKMIVLFNNQNDTFLSFLLLISILQRMYNLNSCLNSFINLFVEEKNIRENCIK